MEKTMNLVSMLFLFLAIAGFDHFYQGVIKHQNSNLLQKIEVQHEEKSDFYRNDQKLAQIYYSNLKNQ